MRSAAHCLLDQPTLVLNRSWLPVNITSVRRALSLLIREAAQAVHPHTYESLDFVAWVRHRSSPSPFIKSVRFRIPVPEVIVLLHYDRVGRRHLPFSRRNLYRRDQLRCQYCGCRPGIKRLTIDHILPRSQGGKTTWTNCVLACTSCNGRKGNCSPDQVGLRLLSRPVQPEWITAFGAGLPSLDSFLEARHPPRSYSADRA